MKQDRIYAGRAMILHAGCPFPGLSRLPFVCDRRQCWTRCIATGNTLHSDWQPSAGGQISAATDHQQSERLEDVRAVGGAREVSDARMCDAREPECVRGRAKESKSFAQMAGHLLLNTLHKRDLATTLPAHQLGHTPPPNSTTPGLRLPKGRHQGSRTEKLDSQEAAKPLNCSHCTQPLSCCLLLLYHHGLHQALLRRKLLADLLACGSAVDGIHCSAAPARSW